MSVIDTASRVLREEAAAVLGLQKKLDDSFEMAVNMIASARGRVILTGMGKSGHIARKVAATMASTGTPAFFMHPAEAIPSIRRIGANLIAMVGKTSSTLAENADVVLDCGVEKEADSLGLAPTSSTTAALAMGDALAVCLMERHNFTADNFAIFHPGGSLGKRLLLTVEMVMHKGSDNPVVPMDSTVKEALFIMTDKGLGAVNVVDKEGNLVGLLTDGDVRRGLEQGTSFLDCAVEKVMTVHPMVIEPNKLAAQGLHVMEKHAPHPITVLPVVKDGRAVGMLHITDLLKQGVV